MATYYWRGGAGTWNNSNTTNWSNVSGGAGGFGPPTSADTVIFDDNSGGSTPWTVTVASTAAAANTSFLDGSIGWLRYLTLSLSGNANLASTGTFSLQMGNINLNTYSLTVNRFTIADPTTNFVNRTITFGTGSKIVCTAYSGTVFDSSSGTYVVLYGTERRVEIFVPSTASTSTFTSLNNYFGLHAVYGPSSGNGTISVTTQSRFRSIYLPNNVFSFSYGTIYVCGSMTVAGGNVVIGSIGQNYLYFVDGDSSNGEVFDINVVGAKLKYRVYISITGTRSCRLLSNLDLDSTGYTGFFIAESGNLNLNGYTVTTRSFNSTNSNTRSFTFGVNGKIKIVGRPDLDHLVTLLDLTNTSGLTVNDPANSLIEVSIPNASNTCIIRPGDLSSANAISYKTIPGPGTSLGEVSFQRNTATKMAFRSLTCYNGSYTVNFIGNFNIYGSLTIEGSSVVWDPSNTVTCTIGNTSLSEPNNLINVPTGYYFSNYIEIIGANTTSKGVVVSNSFQVWRLTLTSGRLDLNNQTISINTIFDSSNSNFRNIDFRTSGNITILYPANNIVVVELTNSTNLEVYGNSIIRVPKVDSSFSTDTCYIAGASSGVLASGANLVNIEIAPNPTASNPLIRTGIALRNNFKSISFSDFRCTIRNINAPTLWGNLTLPSTSTNITFESGTNAWTFRNSDTSGSDNLINTNSITVPFPIAINSSSSIRSCKLSNDFTSTNSITLTSGIFDANGYAVSINSFVSNNSNSRTLKLGNGAWTITGTSTAWNILNGSNLTLIPAFSSLTFSSASSSATSFFGGGKTYGTVVLAGSSTQFSIVGSNTFSLLTSSKTFSNSLLFEGGTTNTFGDFSVTGTGPSAVVTLSSISSSVFYMVRSGVGVVNLDYMDISYSYVSPSATWFAGPNSVDSGNNSGWVGFVPPSPPSSGFMVFF